MNVMIPNPMKSNRACSGLLTAPGNHAWRALSFALAIAVALPEEVPAATMVNIMNMPTFARAESPASDPLLVHYYCGYSGGVAAPVYGYYGGAGYYGGYYGAAGVRGTSRRVARRTGRRVARRR